eukprot:344665-Heterocapsa_arctica.AAC.1
MRTRSSACSHAWLGRQSVGVLHASVCQRGRQRGSVHRHWAAGQPNRVWQPHARHHATAAGNLTPEKPESE